MVCPITTTTTTSPISISEQKGGTCDCSSRASLSFYPCGLSVSVYFLELLSHKSRLSVLVVQNNNTTPSHEAGPNSLVRAEAAVALFPETATTPHPVCRFCPTQLQSCRSAAECITLYLNGLWQQTDEGTTGVLFPNTEYPPRELIN